MNCLESVLNPLFDPDVDKRILVWEFVVKAKISMCVRVGICGRHGM